MQNDNGKCKGPPIKDVRSLGGGEVILCGQGGGISSDAEVRTFWTKNFWKFMGVHTDKGG